MYAQIDFSFSFAALSVHRGRYLQAEKLCLFVVVS